MLPPGHTLTGQPIALASALATVRDRAGQLEVVRAYWKLVEAVAMYRFQLDYHQQVQGMQAPASQAAGLAAVQSAAKAELGEAELRVLAAQHTLAALAGLPTDATLPLPADRPHVGPYVTRFRELFGQRAAPPAARRLDRTLPLHFQAIDAQAKAVAAARDALDVSADLRSWTEQLDGLAALRRMQSEWVAAVCRYNNDIAEYAVAVAPLGTNGTELVGLLIRPSQAPVRPLVSEEPSGVEPATFVEPVRPPVVPGEPTPAVRPPVGEPTPARRPAQASVPAGPPGADPAGAPAPVPGGLLPQRPIVPIDRLAPDESEVERAAPDPDAAAPLGPALFEADGEPAPLEAERPSPGAERRTVERPSAVLPPLYPGLAVASAGARAKQLNLTLHWTGAAPENSAEPLDLLACLQRRTADRATLIAAYWTVGQRAAAWQVRQQHGQWLEELSFALADGAPEVRRLRAARAAAEAASAAAHAELVEAQFHLAEATGQSANSAWPTALTRPHAGPYLLKTESLPPELARSWPLRRLADMVPRLSGNVREQATAVVEADAARVEVEAAWLDGAAPFDRVLRALDRQTERTLAFLAARTAYNQAIADYALRVLPETTPDEHLVKTLVTAE